MTAFFKKSLPSDSDAPDKPQANNDSKATQARVSAGAPLPSTEASGVISGNVLRVKFPWITEKIVRISKEGQYAFVVADDCNKNEAKKLIEKIYNVHVTAVSVIRVVGKRRRLGARVGKREGFKKVIVTLQKGETIDVVPH